MTKFPTVRHGHSIDIGLPDGFRAKLIVLKDFLAKSGIESKSIPFLSTCYGKHKAAFFLYSISRLTVEYVIVMSPPQANFF